MRRSYRLAPLALLLALAGCADRWVKPGAGEAEFEVTRSSCEARSMYQFPRILTQVMSGGGYTTPVETKCRQQGNTSSCRTTGGTYIPPSYRMVDQNEDARDRAIDACLIQNGWRRAE